MKDGRFRMGLTKILNLLNNKFDFDVMNILPKYVNYLMFKNNFISIQIFSFDLKNIILFFFKSSIFKINFLNDLAVVDYPDRIFRFKLVYILTSEIYNVKYSLAVLLKNFQKTTASLSFIFKSLIWLERESWDMFGINFFNNNDLRRILTDYNFKGHPLRKDYPLSGFFELIYSEKFSSPIYKQLELMQELRFFILQTEWDDWDND